MKKITMFFAFGLLFFQCSKENELSEDFNTAKTEKSNYQHLSWTASNAKSVSGDLASVSLKTIPLANKKIIKNARLRFQVKSHSESSPKIEKVVLDMGGYIGSSLEQNSGYNLQTTMTIRVSGNKFDQLVNALVKEAFYLNHKSVTAEDVTAQFVDTEARLKTKREVEKRYLDILRQAKSIEDILRVENQLAVIREEIEAKEGQLKLLNDQVSYSTIDLVYYQTLDYEPQPEDSFLNKVYKGIKTGWDGLLSFIVGVFYIWPFIILAGAFFYLIRRWRNNRK